MTTLVIGGTGKQGGATARALLKAGRPVRALVRDPETPAARELAGLGAELVRGDLDDPASLTAAATGVSSVFSIPYPNLADLSDDTELQRGRNLVAAARAAGVEQFVHSSVSGAGDFSHPGWQEEGRWNRHYWDSKSAIDELTRTSRFRFWTVLKPSTFMENLVEASFLFGDWRNTGFRTAFAADTEIAWIAVDDIGAMAAAAIVDPERFHGHDIDLAGDNLTMTEVAAIVSEVLGEPIAAPVLTPEQARALGVLEPILSSQDYMNSRAVPARPELAEPFGVSLTRFRTWALAHLR